MLSDTAFSRFPILTTARLHLRPLGTADTEELFAVKSDLEVTRHYGQEPHRSVEETRAWIERLADSFAERDAVFWGLALQETGALAGAGGFWNFDPGFRCAEIGYELGTAHQGKGLISEALRAMFDWGFDELGLHRIEANPLAANAASIKLLQKLGFHHEGTLRQRHYFRGEFLDQLYFGLLREEWKEGHETHQQP